MVEKILVCSHPIKKSEIVANGVIKLIINPLKVNQMGENVRKDIKSRYILGKSYWKNIKDLPIRIRKL